MCLVVAVVRQRFPQRPMAGKSSTARPDSKAAAARSTSLWHLPSMQLYCSSNAPLVESLNAVLESEGTLGVR